jgi:hypothetical protein
VSQERVASLSLDLDNLWSYMKTHGDEGWERFPSYLDVVVPLALELLARRGLTITFFVVGQDAALEGNRSALASIVSAGHEIGNHSFAHEPWLHLYERGALVEEMRRAEDAIAAATGVRPRGFRGPGFSVTGTVLDVLVERGYRYDASTLPTYIGPIARAFYFRQAKLDASQRNERARLFGTFADGRRSVKAHRARVANGEIVEIPVTTIPVIKVPFHVSYLLYLAQRSERLAHAYFRFALWACRRAGVEPSVLLHPLDVVGGDEVRELAFFPAMSMPGAMKRRFVGEVLATLGDHAHVVTVGDHAGRLASRPLPEVSFAGGK